MSLTGRDALDVALAYERSGLLEKAEARLTEARDQALTRRDTQLELEAELGLARVAGRRGRHDDASMAARRLYERARSSSHPDLAAQAKNILGAVCELRGDWTEAAEHFREALTIPGITPRTQGKLYQNLGAVAAQQGRFDEARDWFSKSVDAWRAVGYGVGLALAVTNLAAATLDTDDAERGAQLALEGMQLAREQGAVDVLGIALENRADALFRLGRRTDALESLAEALGIFSGQKDNLRLAQCLELLGAMYQREEPTTALNAWQKALGIAEQARAEWLGTRLRGRIEELRAAGS
jgi:tetratricopeptide (TPR) repeat protein